MTTEPKWTSSADLTATPEELQKLLQGLPERGKIDEWEKLTDKLLKEEQELLRYIKELEND